MTWIWLTTFPTTNGRIGLSLVMAAATCGVYLMSVIVSIVRGDIDSATVGMQLMAVWTPDLEWLGFLCVWAGLDVLQFGAKRLTDATYTTARQSGAQTTIS